MVAMVATSLKVTLGAVARHPGADVGYQGVLTGGTVAAGTTGSGTDRKAAARTATVRSEPSSSDVGGVVGSGSSGRRSVNVQLCGGRVRSAWDRHRS